ncbi:hypothetical protein SAICODRAFT_72068 [Saitoella complicata NRRL Y-17804]|uniref:uncharacterized protein n=1 Tax=Saitoella complicata (strain BCRC 22490 / CBS 7301 / JCM 7358 / NBRC 10748 / NRRL Y-17804) TaxID=698492 RepID=UPI000866FA32|nr:uncharacterized protein SAICODRAFT_72068 [Saitoella complicata NRRL Y-17804]ODQ52127.1 hypothetical protein SAICODRAFT_72068 [Saitoella complicata NRRL Y-17804]
MDSDDEDVKGLVDQALARELSQPPAGQTPARKKKKRSKKKKGTATGFEEFYAEGPLTPAEQAEEAELYSYDKSPRERLELCVDRYRQKRRFDPTRTKIFSSYLSFGGIKSPNPNLNLNKQIEVENANDMEEAQEFAGADTPALVEDDDDDVEVDFTYVVRAFLAYHVPRKLAYISTQNLLTASELVLNFLRYIHAHRALPEYSADIVSAIEVAKRACVEVPRNRMFGTSAPGRWNLGCSAVFGGYSDGLWVDDAVENGGRPSWDNTVPSARSQQDTLKLSEARELITKVLGPDALSAKKVKEEILLTEVTSINKSSDGDLGTLMLKPWHYEGMAPQETSVTSLEVKLENSALEHAYIGMHIDATFHQLDNGMWYFDRVTGITPSFYIEPIDDDDEDPWS